MKRLQTGDTLLIFSFSFTSLVRNIFCSCFNIIYYPPFWVRLSIVIGSGMTVERKRSDLGHMKESVFEIWNCVPFYEMGAWLDHLSSILRLSKNPKFDLFFRFLQLLTL
jgi:hypothetical protein